MTQQEVMKTFMQSLDNTTLTGAAAFNEAIRASSNFKSFKALRTKFLADLKAAKNWHTFLVEKCGIVLYNKDTGAISGADAGGASVKGATDILPEKGDAKYPEGSEFTVGGMTLYGIPPKETLTDDEQYVVQGLYSWWLRDALALIKESYGLSFDEEGTTNSRLKLEFVDDPDVDFVAYVDFDDDGNKMVFEARVLCVNMAYFKNMNPDDRHGTTSEGNLDRTLTHELVHGLMASNVIAIEKFPPFFIEGGSAELIHGIDDERLTNIIAF